MLISSTVNNIDVLSLSTLGTALPVPKKLISAIRVNSYFIPECIKLETNCFWKKKKAISKGKITVTVPAVIIPHCAPVSNAWANSANPTVNGRFDTESEIGRASCREREERTVVEI